MACCRVFGIGGSVAVDGFQVCGVALAFGTAAQFDLDNTVGDVAGSAFSSASRLVAPSV